MSGRTSNRYSVELRERAVRMVAEIRSEHESEWAAMGRVAQLLETVQCAPSCNLRGAANDSKTCECASFDQDSGKLISAIELEVRFQMSQKRHPAPDPERMLALASVGEEGLGSRRQ